MGTAITEAILSMVKAVEVELIDENGGGPGCACACPRKSRLGDS